MSDYYLTFRKPYRWCIVHRPTNFVVEGGFFTREAAENALEAKRNEEEIDRRDTTYEGRVAKGNTILASF